MDRGPQINDWVVVTMTSRRLLGEGAPPPAFWDASGAIAAAVSEVYRPSTPVEVYSNERPVASREEGDLVPIDRFLGLYTPSERKVTIFVRNIEHYARHVLSCEPSRLETIVRLHEYAHAIVHLGVDWKADADLLGRIPTGAETNWEEQHLTPRNAAFALLHGEAAEFSAQLITWAALRMLDVNGAERIRDLFLRMMPLQPGRYTLAPAVTTAPLSAATLHAVLALLRGQIAPPPSEAGLKGAAEALALWAAAR